MAGFNEIRLQSDRFGGPLTVSDGAASFRSALKNRGRAGGPRCDLCFYV